MKSNYHLHEKQKTTTTTTIILNYLLLTKGIGFVKDIFEKFLGICHESVTTFQIKLRNDLF